MVTVELYPPTFLEEGGFAEANLFTICTRMHDDALPTVPENEGIGEGRDKRRDALGTTMRENYSAIVKNLGHRRFIYCTTLRC